MARRLAFFFNKQEANPGAPPFASDYSRDDHDPSESDGEEFNDEDPDNADSVLGFVALELL